MNSSHLGEQVCGSFFIFGYSYITCGISVWWPGIEPKPSSVKAQSPKHWTTRKFPVYDSTKALSHVAITTNKTQCLPKPPWGFFSVNTTATCNPWQAPIYSPSPKFCLFPESPINGTKQHAGFWISVLSHSIRCLQFMHVVAWIISSFFFHKFLLIAENFSLSGCITVCVSIYHWMSCFQFGTITLKSAANILHRVFCFCFRSLNCVRLFVTPWTVTHQAPLSMGFSSQEYWSQFPFPSPGIFPTQGSNPISCISCIAGWFFTTELPEIPILQTG